MKNLVYKLSFFVALLTFIINVFSGITLLTCLFRSVLVFLLMLLISVLALKILRWALMLSQKKPKPEIITSNENKS